MKIYAKRQKLETVDADLLIVNLFAQETKPGGGTGAVDAKLNGFISKRIKQLSFKGTQAGEYFIFDNPKPGAKQIMVISLGEKKQFGAQVIRKVAALSLLEAKKQNAKTIATILHGAGNGGLDPKLCAQSLTEGVMLSDYSYDSFRAETRKENQKRAVKEIIICQQTTDNLAAIKFGINQGKIFCEAQTNARNLVNEPPQTMNPETLAKRAKEIAMTSPHIRAKVYNRKEIENMGMKAFLAIDQGSDQDPYFIHLTYTPKKPKTKIALVGKSITYDSGGLSLKPSDGMTNMKMDMAGGATVLGIFSVLAKLKPNVEIHGIIPACENMPSGKAIKVDDVVTASNGKTIEIAHTDAEGRVVLADALVYAEKLDVDTIIDLATLTGAAIVALGNDIAALMTDDESLEKELTEASKATGEKIWPLPLEPTYREHIKSEIADIKNIGKRGAAGTIAGGMFLKEFIKKTPWAHLDIAGPAWDETKQPLNQQIGGSGFGTRLLLEYITYLN